MLKDSINKLGSLNANGNQVTINANNEIINLLKNLTQLPYMNNSSNSFNTISSIATDKKYSGNYISTFMNSGRTLNTPQSSNNNLFKIDIDKHLLDEQTNNINNMMSRLEEGGLANPNFLSSNSFKTLRELQQLNFYMNEMNKK